MLTRKLFSQFELGEFVCVIVFFFFFSFCNCEVRYDVEKMWKQNTLPGERRRWDGNP